MVPYREVLDRFMKLSTSTQYTFFEVNAKTEEFYRFLDGRLTPHFFQLNYGGRVDHITNYYLTITCDVDETFKTYYLYFNDRFMRRMEYSRIDGGEFFLRYRKELFGENLTIPRKGGMHEEYRYSLRDVQDGHWVMDDGRLFPARNEEDFHKYFAARRPDEYELDVNRYKKQNT